MQSAFRIFLVAASASYFGPSLIPHGLPLQDPLKASMAEAATRLDPEADGAAAVPYLEFTADVLLEAVTAGTVTGAIAAKRGANGLETAAGALKATDSLNAISKKQF